MSLFLYFENMNSITAAAVSQPLPGGRRGGGEATTLEMVEGNFMLF